MTTTGWPRCLFGRSRKALPLRRCRRPPRRDEKAMFFAGKSAANAALPKISETSASTSAAFFMWFSSLDVGMMSRDHLLYRSPTWRASRRPRRRCSGQVVGSGRRKEYRRPLVFVGSPPPLPAGVLAWISLFLTGSFWRASVLSVAMYRGKWRSPGSRTSPVRGQEFRQASHGTLARRVGRNRMPPGRRAWKQCYYLAPLPAFPSAVPPPGREEQLLRFTLSVVRPSLKTPGSPPADDARVVHEDVQRTRAATVSATMSGILSWSQIGST